MQNLVLTIILLAIVGMAAWYVYRAKKKGQKCIGCPGGCCTQNKDGCSSCCGCSGDGQA